MLQYLIKCSISLAVLFIFYRAVLRPLTFYQCNRFYLLGYSLLSFVIPFIDISLLLPPNSNPRLENIIPSISYYSGVSENTPAVVQVSWLQRLSATDWLLLAFFAGVVFMLVRLARQYLSLRRIRRTAVLLDADAGIQLYETSVAISPFSFGNAIYFNRQLHTEDELQRIIQHEFVHVKQQHTIDLMVGELLCVFNWFNPFAWLIRHGIRQNLEFIADNNVVANGLDKKEYQYLLLKCVGVPQYAIANNFNFSSLKKRIAMMNKMKSARLHLTKFLFVLPLLVVLLLAFRNKINNTDTRQMFVYAGIVYDAKTAQPLAGVAISERYSSLATVTDANGFFKIKIPIGADSIFKVACDFHLAGYENADDRNLSFSPAKVKTYADLVFAGMRQHNNSSYDGLTVSTHYQIPVTDEKQFIADPDYAFVQDKFITYQQSMTGSYVPGLPPGSSIMLQYSTAQSGDTTKEIFYYGNGDHGAGKPRDTATVTYYNGIKAIYHLYNLSDPAVRQLYKKRYGAEPYPRPVSAKREVNAAAVLNSKEDTIPNPPPPPVELAAPKVETSDIYPPEKKGTNSDKFENITIRSNTDPKKGIKTHTATVTLKNGTKEKYNLHDPKEKAAYIEKYGALPVTAPPPPPPPVPGIAVSDGPLKTGTNPPQPPAADVTMSGGDFNVKDYQSAGKPPLYIIDGKEMPAGYRPDDLNGADIKTINVWKEKNAIDRFGARGKNGVIEIILKPENERGKSPLSQPVMIWKADKLNFGSPDSLLGTLKVSDSTGSVEVAMRKNSLNYFPKDVLIVIDGREIPSELNFGTLISPENIERMTVMKGNTATALYGEKARNGAIIIISKAAKGKTASPVKTDTTVTFINKPLNRTGDNRIQVGQLKKHDTIKKITKNDVNPDSYIISGKAKDGSASEISLGAFNVPQGSVSVSAGGTGLKEGIDYSIDYGLGIVKILNQAIINTGVPVNCNLHRKEPVIFNFGELIVSGSIVTNENESTISGSFSFAYTGQAPLVIVDGAEMTGMKSFKAKKGNYKMLALGAKEAIAKYGDRAKYGALEIFNVKNNGKA